MRFSKGILGVGLSALVVGSFGIGCSKTDSPAADTAVVTPAGMQTATLNVKGMT
jgi:hypothetical protein